ncbi:MAG: carboxypeptidase regulatory-like domain-containing protein [bacterium]|nr:carboxypeptidase regulatory-like domain-containing protein [bacterium]
MFHKSLMCFFFLFSLLLSGCIMTGLVTDEDGHGLEGVTVTLTGDANLTTTTNSMGSYTFGNLFDVILGGTSDDLVLIMPGSYTVTPSKSGYSFTPASASVTINAQALGDLEDIPGPDTGVDFVVEDSNIEARIDEIFGDAPYGELNREQARRMVDVVPEEDGPFYMINLIAYSDNAEYPDGRQTELTGEEANKIYGTLVFPILLEIGARPVFAADVARRLIDPDMAEWDQVGVVRYPGRAEFIAMLERQDFREAAIHKRAGVERSIVIVAHEDPDAAPEDSRRVDLDALPFPPTAEDPVIGVCHLLKYNEIAQYPDGRETDLTGPEAMDIYTNSRTEAALRLGIRAGLWLIPEGELIGDGQVWDEFRINLFPSQAAFDEMIATDTVGQANLIHRWAAIADTYSVLTIPMINEFGYLEP